MFVSISSHQLEDLQNLLGGIKANWEKLDDWELRFCSDQEERFEKHGADIILSPKQWAILRKIHDKVTDA